MMKNIPAGIFCRSPDIAPDAVAEAQAIRPSLSRGPASAAAKSRRARSESRAFHEKLNPGEDENKRLSAQRHKATDTVFIAAKSGRQLYIKNENGHFYRVPPADVQDCQVESAATLKFTAAGLANLRKKYHDEIHGTAAFVYSIFNFTHEYKQSKDMAEHPALFPYLPDEKFLIVPNAPSYTPDDGSDLSEPMAQKLKDDGVVLCGWFMHPGLSCLRQHRSRQLLDELSVANAGKPKPVLSELREYYANSDNEDLAYKWDNRKRDVKTITEMERGGQEYLASILDLNAGHLDMLRGLRQKILDHLNAAYRVDENDDVGLYFHFPYIDSTVTLHLHIRVNHGLHPSEKDYGFTLDEIIDGLSSGKSIDAIVLSHQEKKGHFYCMHESKGFYRNIDGIEIAQRVKNTNKLEPDEAAPLASRDDGWDWRAPRGRPS